MRHSLVLSLIVVVALNGCKGKLPIGMSKLRTFKFDATQLHPLKPGDPAHHLVGELIFGPEPTQNLGIDDITVVSWDLDVDKTPNFFYHYKLTPKVRFVQYVTEKNDQAVLNRIAALKKRGESIEGLSVLKVDYSTHGHLWFSRFGFQDHLVQNGIVRAGANDETLDPTIFALIEGKFDTKKQLTDLNISYLDYRRGERRWDKMFEAYESHSKSLRQLTKESCAEISKSRDVFVRDYFAQCILSEAACMRWSEVAPIFEALRSTDSLGYFVCLDFDLHRGHDECDDRLKQELELAYHDPASTKNPGYCRTMAKQALKYGKKQIARNLLTKMMASDSLKPRYAKLIRQFFQDDFDELMPKTL